jgi:hypothetical protein
MELIELKPIEIINLECLQQLGIQYVPDPLEFKERWLSYLNLECLQRLDTQDVPDPCEFKYRWLSYINRVKNWFTKSVKSVELRSTMCHLAFHLIVDETPRSPLCVCVDGIKIIKVTMKRCDSATLLEWTIRCAATDPGVTKSLKIKRPDGKTPELPQDTLYTGEIECLMKLAANQFHELLTWSRVSYETTYKDDQLTMDTTQGNEKKETDQSNPSGHTNHPANGKHKPTRKQQDSTRPASHTPPVGQPGSTSRRPERSNQTNHPNPPPATTSGGASSDTKRTSRPTQRQTSSHGTGINNQDTKHNQQVVRSNPLPGTLVDYVMRQSQTMLPMRFKFVQLKINPVWSFTLAKATNMTNGHETLPFSDLISPIIIVTKDNCSYCSGRMDFFRSFTEDRVVVLINFHNNETKSNQDATSPFWVPPNNVSTFDVLRGITSYPTISDGDNGYIFEK